MDPRSRAPPRLEYQPGEFSAHAILPHRVLRHRAPRRGVAFSPLNQIMNRYWRRGRARRVGWSTGSVGTAGRTLSLRKAGRPAGHINAVRPYLCRIKRQRRERARGAQGKGESRNLKQLPQCAFCAVWVAGSRARAAPGGQRRAGLRVRRAGQSMPVAACVRA